MNVQPVPPPAPAPASRQTTAREAFAVVFRRKWLIIGLFLATTFTVLLIAFTTPTVYVSAGRVLIRRGEKESALMANRQIYNDWESELGSEIEIIRSWEVLREAQGLLDAQPGPKMRISPGQVDAEVMGKSNVIAIAYQDRKPQVAERGAQAMIQAYITFRDQKLLLRYPRPYFEREIARADSEVRALIEERRRYMNEAGAVDPPQQERATMGLIESIDSRRIEAEADLAAVRAEQRSMRELRANPAIEDPSVTMPMSGGSSALEELKRRVVDQQAHVATLRESYRDDAPEVLLAGATLDTLQAMLKTRVDAQLAIAEMRATALESRVVSLNRDLADARRFLSALPDKESRMNEYDLRYSLAKDRYDDLLIKARNADVNEVTSSPLTVVLLTPAGPAGARNSHDYVRLALAPSFSLLVGVGLAFFLDGLDLTVRSAGHAEETLDLPVLAAITERRTTRRRSALPDRA